MNHGKPKNKPAIGIQNTFLKQLINDIISFHLAERSKMEGAKEPLVSNYMIVKGAVAWTWYDLYNQIVHTHTLFLYLRSYLCTYIYII